MDIGPGRVVTESPFCNHFDPGECRGGPSPGGDVPPNIEVVVIRSGKSPLSGQDSPGLHPSLSLDLRPLQAFLGKETPSALTRVRRLPDVRDSLILHPHLRRSVEMSVVPIVKETNGVIVALFVTCPACEVFPLEPHEMWVGLLCEDCVDSLLTLLRPDRWKEARCL